MTKNIFLIIIFGSISLAANIVVDIKNIPNSNSKIYLGLYNAKEQFPIQSKVYKSAILDPNNSSYTFSGIPLGIYAVALFHDQNNNGKLDKNFLGIPKEGYGFSNNPKVFATPTFEKCSFRLKKNTKITIKVIR